MRLSGKYFSLGLKKGQKRCFFIKKGGDVWRDFS